MENDPRCKNEQKLGMSILEKKYGKPKEQCFLMTLYDAETIDRGNRDIFSKFSGFMDTTIDIRYTNQALEKQADEERIEIEREKLDASGL